MSGISRRNFLGLVPAVCLIPQISSAQTQPAKPVIYPSFPSQNPDLVREMVGVSHFNLARVKELVGQSPALAKACWDWGYGDWETAIGAASHTGQVEIVEFLIANGARPDIFTYAMMGNLEAVKALIKAQPGVQRIPGPHGISILDHAEAGSEVHKFLLSLGDADPKAVSLPISDEEKKRYLGDYRLGESATDLMQVSLNRDGALQLSRGTSRVRLHRVAEHDFAPTGAPSVRIKFQVQGDKATILTVHDPDIIATATRA